MCVPPLFISKVKRVWVAEIEAASLSSQDRLTCGHEAVQQAKDHRAAGRLDEASGPVNSSPVEAGLPLLALLFFGGFPSCRRV